MSVILDIFVLVPLLIAFGIVFKLYRLHNLRATIMLLSSLVVSISWAVLDILFNLLSVQEYISGTILVILGSIIPIFLYVYFAFVHERNYIVEILLIWYFTTIISNIGLMLSGQNLYLSSYGILVVSLMSIVLLLFVYRSWQMIQKSINVKTQKIKQASTIFMISFIIISITPVIAFVQYTYNISNIVYIPIIASVVMFIIANKIYTYVSYITPFNLRNMYIFHANSGISIYDYSTKFSSIDPTLMTSLVISVRNMVRSLMQEELCQFKTEGSVFMVARTGSVGVMVVGDTYNTVIHDGMSSFIDKIDKYMFSEDGESIREKMDSKSIIKAMMRSELPMLVEVIYEN